LKRDVAFPLLGVTSFYEDTQSLAHNQLNLGAWHGNHDVRFSEPVNPTDFSFRCRFDEGAYLVIVVGSQGDMSEGIRLTNADRFPGAHLRWERNGEFTRRTLLDGLAVKADHWYSVKLHYGPESCSIALDGVEIASIPLLHQEERSIGFRNGYRGVSIDDVVIDTHDPDVSFVEGFDRFAHLPKEFAAVLSIALLVFLGLVAFAKRKTPKLAIIVMSVGVINLVASPVGFGFCYLYTEHMADKYPKASDEDVQRAEAELKYDNQRYILNDLAARYPKEKPEDTQRVLLVGSSQTWGSGVLKSSDRFSEQLEVLLNGDGDGLPQVECINSGMPGTKSRTLHPYFEELATYQPDVVLINLGHNDEFPARFTGFLRRYIDDILAIHAAPVFSLEPVSAEKWGPWLDRHSAMNALILELDIPHVQTTVKIDELFDTGFLYWDSVHLTSYGHRLMAEALHEEVRRVLDEVRLKKLDAL
jgi:lysophospholipase L1-like esterase